MDTARWNHVKALFGNALALPPGQRAAFLADACSDDADLQAQVAALLDAYDDAPAFFDSLAEGVLGIASSKDDPDDASPDDSHQLIGQTISHYEVLEKLGRGGMGIVYKARDVRLGRTVALKFLPPPLSADTRAKQRFMTEAQAASALDHPNIGTIYEIDETDDGYLFIAMTCYEGETLKEKIRRGPLPLDEALSYTVQLARGLAMAHAHGIVHRDIKPANVMITRPSPVETGGVVKILDFGIAKVADASLTKTGSTLGTVAYMSPEQAAGRPVDHLTDLWSLGVVLYEMLSGRRPFTGEHEQVILSAIGQEEPVPVSQVRAEVPAALEAVVMRCLEKDPRKRYQSVTALHKDLKQKMGLDQGVTLPRPSSSARSRRFRRIAAPVAGVLFLLLLWQSIPSVRALMAQWLDGRGTPAQMHLVVLPTQSPGADAASQDFVDGIVETVTRTLSVLEPFDAGLWVVPRDAIRDYGGLGIEEAAQMLGINGVVTVAVLRRGEQVRVMLDLVDADARRILNSRQITLAETQLALLQGHILDSLSDMLDIDLTPGIRLDLTAGGTASPRAYRRYTEALGRLQRYDNIDHIDAAIGLFEQALQDDSVYALAYAGLGEAYWRKFESTTAVPWAEAAERYSNRALDLNAQLTSVQITLGLIYTGLGRYGIASLAFQLALERDPHNAAAYSGLGAVYEAQVKMEEAEAAYQQAIALKPGYWGGYNTLGRFYYKVGRYEEAVMQFERVLALTPSNARAYSNLGGTYWMLGRTAEAIAVFQRAIEISPRYDFYSNLATLYFYEGAYGDAARMYENALTLHDNDYQVWGYLASAYYWAPNERGKAQGAYQRAAALAEEHLQVTPRDPHLLSSLAGYYGMLGARAKALALLDELIAMNPENLEVLFRIADIYEYLGERDRALSWFEKTLQKGYALAEIERNPWLRDVRADPRFQVMLERYQSSEQ